MLDRIVDETVKLHWGAGLRAAWFALVGIGDPTVVYPAVRTKNGLLAFLTLGFFVIVAGILAVILTGTFGADSLARGYEIGSHDGIEYLWKPFSLLLGSLGCLGALAWANGHVLRQWIGFDDRAELFWLSLCLPASFCVIAFNLCTYAVVSHWHRIFRFEEPYNTWLGMGALAILLAMFLVAFAILAVLRFQRVFPGHHFGFARAVRFCIFACGLFAACSWSFGLTGKSLEFVPGHPTADLIRSGEIPSIRAQLSSCRINGDVVECAVVLWPKDFQRYTLYGSWDLLPLVAGITGEHATAPQFSLASWRLYDGEKSLPWMNIGPNKPQDVVLRAALSAACKSTMNTAAAYRFDVPARATEYSDKSRKFLIVSITNPRLLADTLKQAC